MQTSPRLRRSNRPVTQFAVDCITKFISNGLDDGKYINHNTTVACNVTNRDRSISVFLHETELVNLVIDRNDEPIHLSVSIGSRFTPQGNPAETVIERLNGILDILGIDGIIPEGVRIFKDRENNRFCIGKGDHFIPVGQRYAKNILIQPDAYELRFIRADNE